VAARYSKEKWQRFEQWKGELMKVDIGNFICIKDERRLETGSRA
jgi:hypothetical protein